MRGSKSQPCAVGAGFAARSPASPLDQRPELKVIHYPSSIDVDGGVGRRSDCPLRAGVAQLVEHHLAKVDVESSSLFARSILKHPRFRAPGPYHGYLCDVE